MKIPFNVLDFLDRAELVYGDRIGVVDEPDQPADSWGRTDLAPGRRPRPGHGRRPRRPRRRARRAGRDRLAEQRPPARRPVRRLRLRPRRRADQLPPQRRRGPLHRRALRRVRPPRRSRARRGARRRRRARTASCSARESDEVLLRFDRQPNPWIDPSEDAVASINYTSGTTARPKGVELTHRNLYVNALTFGWHTGVNDRDVYLWAVPMFHCNGWGMVYAITGMGGRHVMLRKVDGPEILRRIDRHGVTFMGGAPAVVNTILAAAAERPGSDPRARPHPHRRRRSTAADGDDRAGRDRARLGVHPDLRPHRDLAAADAQPPPGRVGRPDAGRAGPAPRPGRPAGDRRARSASTTTARCWPAATSSSAATGDQPDETAEVIADGWFHTGDGGRLDDHGYVTISDRKKDVIITGGENVSSIEVEDCLCQHPAVAEAAVIGVPDEKWGETVKAIVVLQPGAHATEAELIEHCRTRLAHYKCPTSIEFDDALARTATGKVQKFKLRAPYWEGRERLVS